MITKYFLTLWMTFSLIGYSLSSNAQLPVDPAIVHGSAIIDTVGNHMTVINSPNTILNWQNFSIGTHNSVYFQQQDATSLVLNRVTGNDPSQILGSLSSNGNIWLINPYGVLFGENARIDAAGLMTSTLDISNIDFLAKRYHFNSTGVTGAIKNQGEIHTSFGGRIWLMGDRVQNEGLVEAPGGQVVLAAGKSIELIDSGAPNVIVRVKAPENETVNLGSLVASSGNIDLHGSIVNQEGIVRANSVGTDAAGHIILKADQATLAVNSQTQADKGSVQIEASTTFNNWGAINGKDITLVANEISQQGQVTAQGGNVTMTARTSTYLDGLVDVSNGQGNGGSIRLTTNKLEGMAGGALRADGEQGGNIKVESRGMVAFSSTLAATGNKQGGTIEVTGDRVYLLNADINTSGGIQGGTVHLGGGWQGGGDLLHAREVLIGAGSEIKANGGGGATAMAKGGEITVWSTQSSEHYGLLQANDGGRIELSSKGEIRQTGGIQAGAGGVVLFDPKNLIITDNPPDNLTLAQKISSDNALFGSSLTDNDRFGTAVALQGDLLAVGAWSDNTGGIDRGAVHLFTGVGTDFSGLTWQKKLASNTGAIGMPELVNGDAFGQSIALDGDHLVVGAYLDDTGGIDRGAVHLFTGVGTNFSGLAWQNKIASGQGANGMQGLGNGDGFGQSVALDGDRLAVGAWADNTGGFARGAVHLFTGVGTNFSELTWKTKLASQQGAINMPGLANNDSFGTAIALDGDRLAVGARFDDTGGIDRGAVHLFTGVGADFSGLTWQKKLASNTGANSMPILEDDNRFGRAIAFEDNLLVVGARRDDTGGIDRGAVYLFTGVGIDFSGLTWQKKLATNAGASGMPTLADGDRFGAAVALDGDRLVVGADTDKTGGDRRGAVHLFTGVGSDFSGLTWKNKLASEQGAIWSKLADNDHYGTSVALQGDLLAVGARFDNTGGTNRGAVYLFTGVGIDFSGLTWQKKLASNTGASGMPVLTDKDSFGFSLALDGDRLAVGAFSDSTGGTDRGAVHLFTGVGTNFSGLTWQKKLASNMGASDMPELVNGDRFGTSIALDGNRLVVGAEADDTGGADRGAVHLFTGVGTNFSGLTWQNRLTSEQGAIGMPGLPDGNTFGASVALDGDRLAVGARLDDTGGIDRGAVHLFTGVGTDFSGLTWQKKLASNTGANSMPELADDDRFGRAIAFDDNLLVVGARRDNTNGIDRGAVHLFTGVGADFSGLTWQNKIASGQGAIGMPGLTDGDRFGAAVALDGDRLVVGADADDTGGLNRGAVYLFKGLSGSGAIDISDVSNASFSANPSGDSYITPATLTALLDTGAAVTLQANNDIKVVSAINVQQGGAGGNLTLQAGRNIMFSANVTTDNGNLTAIAGDTNANAAFRDSGLPTLTIDNAVSLNVGSGIATLAAVGGNLINLNSNSAISTNGSGRWLIYASNPDTSTEGFSSYNKHYNQLFTLGAVPNYATSGNWFLYSIAPELSVTPASSTMLYGATQAASYNFGLSGYIDNDNSTLVNNGSGVFEISGIRSSSDNVTVGVHNMTYLSGLSNDLGYLYVDDASSNNELTVNVKEIAVTSFIVDNKAYDGNTNATISSGTLSDVVPGDLVSLSGTGAFENESVGVGKLVMLSSGLLTGADSNNYILGNSSNLTALADITPVGVTTTPNDSNTLSTKQGTTDTSIQAVNTAALATRNPLDMMNSHGRVMDKTSSAAPESTTKTGLGMMSDSAVSVDQTSTTTSSSTNFGRLSLAQMSASDMQHLIDFRKEFKEKLFSEAISKLKLDPNLSDVPVCSSVVEIDSGKCRISDAQRQELKAKIAKQQINHRNKYKVRIASLPQIERKIIVLFGIDQYADATIPSLVNAISDAEGVGQLFADKMGYEILVVKNATRTDMVRTLNQLSTEMEMNDSVVIYYAGHGYMDEKTGNGYWIPADASAKDPESWISNVSISEMLAEIRSKQLVMISDSCYSGAFTKEQKLGMSRLDIKPDDILVKRSVMVMSSGGDEPVADEGRGGHSIFAWFLMQALHNVENWKVGASIFDQIQREVKKSFPQTPQYGVATSAGHEEGGDYLFEFRQLENLQ